MSEGNKQVDRQQKLNWPVLLIMSTAYMAVVLNIQGIKALMPHLEAEFMLSGAQAGLYTSFYFASATIVAIFSGRIVDIIGSRKGLIIGVGSVGILIIIQALSPTYLIILLLAFFAGFGFSIITPSSSKGVLNIVPKEKRAFALGITQSGSGVGGVLGALALPAFAEFLGWRVALMISGGFAILMALFLVKYYKANDGKKKGEDDSQEEHSSMKQDVALLLKHKYLLWLCVMGGVFGLAISSVATHLTLFLTQDMGFTTLLAGVGLATFQVGGIFAHLGWGWFSDSVLKGDRRTGLIIVGVLIALLYMITGLFITPMENISPFIVLTAAFLLGLTILGLPSLYLAGIGEAVEDKYVGTATGMALTLVRIANVVFPPLFGLLSDISGSYALSWSFMGMLIFATTISFYWFTRELTVSYQVSKSRT